MLKRENVCFEETNVFVKPNADKLACLLRRENVCFEETNVFVKPNADKLACLLRRENVCFEETNINNPSNGCRLFCGSLFLTPHHPIRPKSITAKDTHTNSNHPLHLPLQDSIAHTVRPLNLDHIYIILILSLIYER